MPCPDCGEAERLILEDCYEPDPDGYYDSAYRFRCLACDNSGIKSHSMLSACRRWSESPDGWKAQPEPKPANYGNW